MKELFDRYPGLSVCENEIKKAIELLTVSFENGGKLLLCGNGGSCADCEHIAGELMKGFKLKRELSEGMKAQMKKACPALTEDTLGGLQGALPAIPLTAFGALNTAFCNDAELFHYSYVRYIENRIRDAYGFEGTPVRITIKQRGDQD